jgi:hypothetical protein
MEIAIANLAILPCKICSNAKVVAIHELPLPFFIRNSSCGAKRRN